MSTSLINQYVNLSRVCALRTLRPTVPREEICPSATSSSRSSQTIRWAELTILSSMIRTSTTFENPNIQLFSPKRATFPPCVRPPLLETLRKRTPAGLTSRWEIGYLERQRTVEVVQDYILSLYFFSFCQSKHLSGRHHPEQWRICPGTSEGRLWHR